MTSERINLRNIAYAYGYRDPVPAIEVGDEVIILNNLGRVVAQDLVESVSDEAILIGGSWWYDSEYSFKKLDE